MDNLMRQRSGSCHCGNVTYELGWPDDLPLVPRRCSCTFCAKHSPVYVGHPRASLSVVARDPSAISKYEFGTRTALFHCCANCGVFLFATCVIDGREYAVLNANTLDGLAPPVTETRNYDGEEVTDRLARRSTNWIANFTMSGLEVSPPPSAAAMPG